MTCERCAIFEITNSYEEIELNKRGGKDGADANLTSIFVHISKVYPSIAHLK